MPKTMHGHAKRANVAPISRLKPKTWMNIQTAVPFVAIGVCVPFSFWSPVVSLLLFFALLIVYVESQRWVAKPVFERKPGEPCINFATDELGLPVMIPVSTFVRHSLLIGTTGSGKTTTIRTVAESFMKLGGGFCFIDGKADVTDTYKILYEIVCNTDREEDLLVLNFLNPNQSHSFNFLLEGEPDFLAEVMVGLCKDAGGDQAYWQGKAKMLMKTILSVLIFMRDNPATFPEFRINIVAIKRYLILNNLKELFFDQRIPFYWNCPGCPDFDQNQIGECKKGGFCDKKGNLVKQRLSSYLQELGVDLSQNSRAAQKSPAAAEAERQHGFYVQQWGEPLDLVVGAFGKIFNAEYPDINIKDVVTNSRVLIVLLPSLSYSPSTLQSLGRIVLNTFKIALTTGLGKDIEGNVDEITMKVKSNRPSVPFMLIADEYGSYAVEGIDTLLAQARSLGMGIMISVQELASLLKASEVDAKRMIANTNLKFFMKIEDSDTAEYIAKRAGKEYFMLGGVTSDGGAVFQKQGNFDGQYSYQEHERLEARDLTSLEVGEGYVIYGDEVRKYSTRYIPEKNNIKEMRMMKFIRRPIDFAKDAAEELLEAAKKRLDKVFHGTWQMMQDFAIGIREDRLLKKYFAAMDQHIEETMEIPHINFDDQEQVTEFINNLQDEGYLKVKNKEELIEIRTIVVKRSKYNNFVESYWDKVCSQEAEFWNEILKPSEEVNAFLQQSFKELAAMKDKK